MHTYEMENIRKYMETLVHTRWTKDELEKHLQEKFDLTSTLNEIDEDGCVSDYAFVMNVYEDYGYIDIYFLKVPYDERNIYITEVSVDINI